MTDESFQRMSMCESLTAPPALKKIRKSVVDVMSMNTRLIAYNDAKAGKTQPEITETGTGAAIGAIDCKEEPTNDEKAAATIPDASQPTLADDPCHTAAADPSIPAPATGVLTNGDMAGTTDAQPSEGTEVAAGALADETKPAAAAADQTLPVPATRTLTDSGKHADAVDTQPLEGKGADADEEAVDADVAMPPSTMQGIKCEEEEATNLQGVFGVTLAGATASMTIHDSDSDSEATHMTLYLCKVALQLVG